MSERKVLTKYYPPDFDPAAIERTRGPKTAGPKVQTVRLMAPFSMKCTACGEYIYKGRKFNARKETTDERYFSIPIYRFYIRCTRCSAEITFKTDPRNMDYECEKGARRNFEVWRQQPPDGGAPTDYKESEEERLERLAQEESERGAMAELEAKVTDAKREMEIADALDEIRTRNARNERAKAKELDVKLELARMAEEDRVRAEREDEEAARRAFRNKDGERVRRLVDHGVELELGVGHDNHDTRNLSDLALPIPKTAPSSSSDELPLPLPLPLSPSHSHSRPLTSRESESTSMPPPPVPTPPVLAPLAAPVGVPEAVPTFKRVVKKKKDFAAGLGIKKKVALV